MKKIRNMKILCRLFIIESYVRFPLIGSRRYSTIDSSLVQLSEDIEFVYNDLITHTNLTLSRSEFAVLQQKLLSGIYVLSPLRFKAVDKENLSQFLSDCPDCVYFPSNNNPDIFTVIMPEKEDNLVLMGLSRMLYRLSKGYLPKDGSRLANEEEEFYSSIEQMGSVNRLYHIYISETYIPVSQVLNMVKFYVEEDSVCFNLIKSFLNHPYKDSMGALVYLNRLPLGGEITRVLQNLVYINLVDKELQRALEGIAYSRYNKIIIISTKEYDEDIFNEDLAYAFMDFLGLGATVTSIGPGDEPICCGNKNVVVDMWGGVLVY